MSDKTYTLIIDGEPGAESGDRKQMVAEWEKVEASGDFNESAVLIEAKEIARAVQGTRVLSRPRAPRGPNKKKAAKKEEKK